MKVNNKKPVRRIAVRSLLANKRRNLIAVLAITLTAVLFTTLFTILLSIKSSYETSFFKELGGCEHGTFKDVTEVDIEVLSSNQKVKEWGERIIIGVNSSAVFNRRSAEISYMDDNTAKWSFIELKEGHMPVAKNEVIMDTEALRLLGVEPKIGAEVELSFGIYGIEDESVQYTDTFVLSGYWEFDKVAPAHFVNVSKEYEEEFVKIAVEKGFGEPRVDMNIMLSSSVGIEGTFEEIALECGYDTANKEAENYIRYGVNPGFMLVSASDSISLETWAAVIAFGLLIAFTGYLIIYNVFQISVAGDISFYGLIKTIGVTPRQLKRIIRIQALVLCAIGIPVGLLAGYGLGACLTGAVISNSNINIGTLKISTSPIIFIGATAFEIVTVLFSTSKPGRIAAKVSPVEALRFTEGADIKKKKQSTKGARVSRMAFANMGRNRKKTVLVFVSLALALVLLNSLNLFVGGFDREKWLSSQVVKDFVVAQNDYFKFKGARLLSSGVSKEDIAYINENVNVKDCGIAYDLACYTNMMVDEDTYKAFGAANVGLEGNISRGENGEFLENAVVEGMDEALVSKITSLEGDASLLNDESGRYIAFMAHELSDGTILTDMDAPAIGEKVKIAFAESIDAVDKKTGEIIEGEINNYESVDFVFTGMKVFEYTVAAYVEVPIAIGPRHSTTGANVVIGSKTLEGDMGDVMVPMFYAFDTPDMASEEAAEAFMKEFSEEAAASYLYESKALKRQEFEEFKALFLILGGVLCGIIGVVGVLNFFNAVMAGIIARKNELAVLQAIGMTGKQVKSMLVIEGLIYTVGAGAIALVLSLAMVPLLNGALGQIFWFYSGHFSVTPVAVMIPVFAVIGFIVPYIAYKGLSKASIVERIRQIG
ncbi:MAG: ABC transporter permease [Lachnospiraceae bacterium]|nr:ABC transporter permease [Lachnospiraceae bacterium]